MKRSVAVLAFISLIASAVSSSAASAEWSPWIAPDRVDEGYLGIIISDQQNSSEQYSRLIANKASSRYLCSSSEGKCANADNYEFNVVLAPCSATINDNCIEKMEASVNSVKSVAKFEKIVYPDHRNRFDAVPSVGLPASSEPSIWSIPTAPHAHGNLYAVVAGINGGFNSGQKIQNPSLYVRLIPVHEVQTGASAQADQNGAYFYPGCWEKPDGAIGCNNLMVMGVGPSKVPCALMFDTGPTCYIQDQFPTNTSFSISLKLSMQVNGWLHGRVSNSNISIEPTASGGENVTISASPVDVPIFAAGDSYSKLPASLQSAYATFDQINSAGGGFTRYGATLNAGPLVRNFTLTPPPYGESAMRAISTWLDYAKNKSVAEAPSWEIHTLTNTTNLSNGCFTGSKGLVGLVSTNSTSYADGPPSLSDGSLNYQVESAHYISDGSEMLGTYSLNLRSDIARCLYGFSNAPMRASVSVVSAGGQQQVATTSFSEGNGWVNFAATGFTFSAPIIKVKLSQDAPAVVPAPAPSVAPTTAPVTAVKPVAKQITITCVKGKTSKKVTAVKPTCPTGYKKR